MPPASPLALTPLSPELYPAVTQKAKVHAFMAQRAAALVHFAYTHGEALVVPQIKRLDTQKPTASEVRDDLIRELGLSDGGVKKVRCQSPESSAPTVPPVDSIHDGRSFAGICHVPPPP